MNNQKVFCFFPLASVGGTERVHLDILKALDGIPKEIFIRYRTTPWKGMDYKRSKEARTEGAQWLSEFKRYGKVTFVSKYLEAPRFGRVVKSWFIKRIAKRINACSNPTVLFWHRESIEFLWPYLAPHVRIIDLIHNNSNDTQPDSGYLVNEWAPRINHRVLVHAGLKKWILQLYEAAHYSTELTDRILVINHKVAFPDTTIVKANDALHVLYVGRDAPEKRIEMFLSIAAQMATHSRIKFQMVGIEDHENRFTNVRCHGLIKDKALLKSIYSTAHVLVLTSESEGFPMVIAEAMAYGCVPIVTAVGAIPTQLRHGEEVILTDPMKCVEETIEWILRLEGNPETLQELSKKAYLYAEEHFAADRFDNAWKQLIQSPS